MERLFFSANARLPQGLPAHELYETLSLSIECEPRWGVILNADCTLVTHLATQFVREAFVGYSIRHDVPMLVQVIEQRYHGGAQRALLAALRDLEQQCQRYWNTDDGGSTTPMGNEPVRSSVTTDRGKGRE